MTLVNNQYPDNLDTKEKAAAYSRLKRRISYLELFLGLAYLLALLFSGFTFYLRDFAVSIGAIPMLWILLYFVILAGFFELMVFPLTVVSGYVVEKKYALTRQTLKAWLWDYVKAGALGLILGGAALELVYFFMRTAGRWWWVLAGTGFALVFVLMAQLAPVLILPLFYKFTPLPDNELSKKLFALCEKAGAQATGIFEWGLAKKTQKVNAGLMGWGRTLRVVLSDNLVKDFNPSEVEVILAHELGHLKLRHLQILIVVQIAVTFLGFALADAAYRFFGKSLGLLALDDVAGLPLLLLVMVAVGLLAMPLVNTLSRKLERAADRFAFELTGLTGSFISSMERIRVLNLSENEPAPWVEFLFHSHPSPANRVLAARQYFNQTKDNS